MTDDPIRRAHGGQYFSYPGYTFAYFREYGITEYEASIDVGLDEWISLKAIVKDDHGSGELLVDIRTKGFFRESW